MALGDVLSQISKGVGTLQYAAQTYLPGHPSTVNASLSSATDLARILEQGAHSTVPTGIGPVFNNQGQETQAQIDAHNQEFPYQGGASMTNVGAPSWFDLQRIGFLVIGVGLIFIGVTMIVRQTGDVGLDNALKRAQLKLTQDQVQNTEKAQAQKTLRAQRVAARAARRAAAKPALAYDRDHASDPRPDFGNKIVDVAPTESKPAKKMSGFSRGVEVFKGNRNARRASDQ